MLSDRNYLALFFRMLRRLVTRLALALAVDFEALELAGFAGETFLSAILGTSPSWVPGAIQLLSEGDGCAVRHRMGCALRHDRRVMGVTARM